MVAIVAMRASKPLVNDERHNPVNCLAADLEIFII